MLSSLDGEESGPWVSDGHDRRVVFQEFLTQSLRDVLGVSPETLRSDRELKM